MEHIETQSLVLSDGWMYAITKDGKIYQRKQFASYTDQEVWSDVSVYPSA